MRLLAKRGRPSFVLTAVGLTKLYGGTLALVGVDLTVRSGELLLVRGANGSGKSTLLRLLAGLASPSAGRLNITGEAGGRPSLAFVGHAGHLYPDLTAAENVTLSARLAGADRESVLPLLDLLGVIAVAHVRCRGLSSGTLRRVALARALATDPDVVIADEPFAGVDEEAADRVATVLAELRDQRRLVVLASHETTRSRAIADQTIELDGGRRIGAAQTPMEAAR